MNSSFIEYLLITLSVYVYIVESGIYYYITLSNSSCPEEPCLSLVQFAANTNQYVHNETDLSLILVPGIHTLDVELLLTNMNKFSISRYVQENGSSIIKCRGQSGRFYISNTTFTSVKGLHFIGCGGNFFAMVNHFILENSIFQGIVGKNTALLLEEVDSAVVVNSTFISNSMGSISASCIDASATSVGGAIAALGSSVHVISSNFTNNSASHGGVFRVFRSSFIVTNSTFTNNIAACGGMLIAFSGSSFIIAWSTFTNNLATYGGVIQTFNSSFDITCSTFTDNIATRGGVVDSYQSSFCIACSTFTDNYANYSGVTEIYQSSLDIANSTFARNIAVAEGGVMTAVQSFVSIADSNILNNKASVGGVLKTFQSFINVTVGTFTNNRAFRGGVMSVGHNSSVSIVGSTFRDSSACIGAVIEATESSFDITYNTFTSNKATCHGGVMDATLVSLVIKSCTFISNIGLDGGVMEILDSSLSITNSNFMNNSANRNGGVMYMASSSSSTSIVHNIFNNTFAENWALHGGVVVAVNSSMNILMNNIFNNNFASFGGVMEISDSLVIVIDGTFNNNIAYYGGVMNALSKSSVNITHCKFTKNGVNLIYHRSGIVNTSEISSSNVSSTVSAGGVIVAYVSSFDINYCIFINNSALGGGVMLLNYHTHVSISNSVFKDNTAVFGGVMETFESFCTLTSSTFLSNTAVRHGGVISTSASASFDITNCTLSRNAAAFGAVMFAGIDLMLNISRSHFSINTANSGGLLDISESLVHVRDSIFDHNLGSLHAFSCNITFSGYVMFDRCMEPRYQMNLTDATTHQGGAITVYGSTLVFTGVTYFSNNKASYGGAILATESTIIMFGETLFTSNTAVNNSGGGIYLHQSNIKVKGNCSISQNHATRGGGIHASSTIINVYQPGILQFTKNSAETGGAMYFEGSPRLNLVKRNDTADKLIIFTSNHAKYGGALYVEESTVACSPAVECFIQTLALDLVPGSALNHISTVNIFFTLNSADISGLNLFGGQLDRCVPSPFAEINLKQPITDNSNGISYLRTISNITLDSIASSPLRICFCNSDYQPNCSHEMEPIIAKKGEAFKLTLIAVDQIDHPTDAYVTSLLVSSKGGLGEGQQTQRVYSNCTDIHFNAFSPTVSETIALFPNGPCGNSSLSKRYVDIQFKNCTCSVGFEPSDTILTNCICNCARVLSPYITKCNYSINSLLRVDTTSWITFINDTHPSGYLIHPNCPFDYCYPPFMNVSLNLNLPDGADSQCAYNRTGMLCGACKQNLSLSLGSSRCIHCYDHWPAVLFTVSLAAVLGGMLLVTAMLVLNLTVANGFVSGFIFYGNIVAVSGDVFSSSSPKFASVFVSWLNLDIGIDVCFIDSMDTYTRTWLQLAFPVYIISLVIIIIIASRYFPRFSRLIGRRDPVATLATLVLLSYAKMLSVIIKALSFAVLYYPDGSQETVWLADGNVKYCQGKHIALVIAALLISLVGIPYTFLLFFWQWLVQASKWRLFKWTRNTKLNGFIATYHAPYSSKYRYWTGLLLLVRVVLYVTAVVTESANPKLPPLVTIFLVGGLMFLKGSIGMRVYMKWYADILDLVMNFNILTLAVFNLYDFKDVSKQTAVIYTSTIITLILLVGVVVYHVTLLVNLKKCKHHDPAELTEYCDTSSAPLLSSTEVTYSFVEAPSRCSSPEINLEECEVRLIECDTEKYTSD